MNKMECPNCCTPWKCNGPHLQKMSEIHYSSNEGYYVYEEGWFFIPFEKKLDENQLLDIADTLKSLNSN